MYIHYKNIKCITGKTHNDSELGCLTFCFKCSSQRHLQLEIKLSLKIITRGYITRNISIITDYGYNVITGNSSVSRMKNASNYNYKH